MRCERLALSGDDAADVAAQIRTLVPPPESVRDGVALIIATVRAGGDRAVRDYSRTLDTGGREPQALLVPDDELDAAVALLDPGVRHGIERAIANVEAAARRRARGSSGATQIGENRIIHRQAAVERAAIYVPGGRAPYPSTVVMGAVPAKLAGVGHIAVCSPPRADGDLDPVVLAACRLAGVHAVYRMGGAHAIAALAYGTESVRGVDVIVGPGNLYVQEAKRQVFGQVGIDGFAGPSDLLVIATGDADPEPLALDLLAQAEHGPGTIVVAASDAPATLDAFDASLTHAQETGAVSCLVAASGADQMLALAQAFAPEHLQLVGAEAEALAGRVTRAGCLFVGAGAGTAFGDYIAGCNHILPTNGAARFASAVSPDHFLRRFSEVRIGDPETLADAAAPLARAEGFELHARSMEVRIKRESAAAPGGGDFGENGSR
ncbi:MAG TPA: histidinol dehydrogenase [Solirubrobacteraceae bacterium]|nr:histidinol dehydrogenase [Solirubrobacteraceae bacterium]